MPRDTYYGQLISFIIIMPLLLLVAAVSCLHATAANAQASPELIQTLTSKDSAGHQLIERAFRAPAKGFPQQVIGMFCANVKLRLYWGVYREAIKGTTRTGQDVRRLSRLARHYYPEIRPVDNPFDAPRLSKIDEWLGAKEKDGDRDADDYEQAGPQEASHQGKGRVGKIKTKVKRKLSFNRHDNDQADKEIKLKMNDSLDNDGAESTTTAAGKKKKKKPSRRTRVEKLKDFVKKHGPRVGMTIYTRWQTMWWLMMSCLYTKYYLWDPALDMFIKLKKTVIMYPDFLMLKLQDIDCLPTKFFQRIISACKIINPLLNYSLGQLSLDNMMRFKSRAH